MASWMASAMAETCSAERPRLRSIRTSGIRLLELPGAEALHADLTLDDRCGELLDAGVFAADIQDLLSVVHHDVTITDLECVVKVVGDEHGAHPFALELGQVVEQSLGRSHGKRRRRLIEND